MWLLLLLLLLFFLCFCVCSSEKDQMHDGLKRNLTIQMMMMMMMINQLHYWLLSVNVPLSKSSIYWKSTMMRSWDAAAGCWQQNFSHSRPVVTCQSRKCSAETNPVNDGSVRVPVSSRTGSAESNAPRYFHVVFLLWQVEKVDFKYKIRLNLRS